MAARAIHRRVAAVWLVAALSGCAAPPGGLDSPVPSERIRAVGAVVRERDQSAIPRLIAMLGSDDALVRLVALRALESLTGETLGYDHAATEPRRQEAIDRWVERYNRGGLGENTEGTGRSEAGGSVGRGGGNADRVR